MLYMRVHTAVAQQAEKMQIARAAAFHRFKQKRLLEKILVRNHQVDARDVHVNDAARAHIHVAHFAVAHLSLRQPNVRTGSVDQRVGKILEQAVIIGFASESNRISLGLSAVAPTIEHSQHNRFRSFGHIYEYASRNAVRARF